MKEFSRVRGSNESCQKIRYTGELKERVESRAKTLYRIRGFFVVSFYAITTYGDTGAPLDVSCL